MNLLKHWDSLFAVAVVTAVITAVAFHLFDDSQYMFEQVVECVDNQGQINYEAFYSEELRSPAELCGVIGKTVK